MAETDPKKREQAEKAKAGGTWTPAEKARGAPVEANAGEAGRAVPAGRHTDDRAKTEAAAAETEHAPDPDTPVGGGRGSRSMGGSATDPKEGKDSR